MAQSSVAITAGAGTPIDVWVTTTNSYNRQGIVVADPSTDAAAAKVNNTTPGSTDYGLTTRPILPSIPAGANTIGNVNIQAGGTTLQQSGGNLLVNVQNFGVGTFGNSDANSASTTSALTFAYAEVFNGTTWDRLRGDTTNGAWVNIKNSTTLTIKQIPATSGGVTPYKLISAASTNATSVKASAGQLYHIDAQNNTGTIYYVKVYDKASAPTVGTDTPKHTYLIPANTSGAGIVIPLPSVGEAYANGIAIAITGGITDADTTACAANAVVVNLGYN